MVTPFLSRGSTHSLRANAKKVRDLHFDKNTCQLQKIEKRRKYTISGIFSVPRTSKRPKVAVGSFSSHIRRKSVKLKAHNSSKGKSCAIWLRWRVSSRNRFFDATRARQRVTIYLSVQQGRARGAKSKNKLNKGQLGG